MKLLSKMNQVSVAILAVVALHSPMVHANQAHQTALTDTSLTLASDSIIDSINQLGDLDFQPPSSQRFHTDDGVAVVFTPLHQLPIVDVSINFYAGSAADEIIRDDGFGIANMTATMLTQGAGVLDEEAFIAEKEMLGIELGSGITKDSLSLSMRSLSDPATLQNGTQLLTQVLSAPRFDTAVLERNKTRLITSLKQSKQNPAYVASLAYTHALYGDHPYGHASTGDEQSVAALTRDDLQAFQKKFLTKDNVQIIITGDLSADGAKQLANQIAHSLPSGKSYQGTISEPTKPAARHIHIDHDSSQTQIIIGHLAPKDDSSSQARQAFSDLSLGNEILAGSDFNARLMNTIREQKGYTYGIYGGVERLQAAGSYAIRFSTQGDKARDAIKDTLDIITDTLNNGVTTDELELVRLGNKNSFPDIFSSNASIHKTISGLAFIGYPDDHLATRLQRLDNATLDSVNRALKDTIHPSDFIIITVGKIKPDLSDIISTNQPK